MLLSGKCRYLFTDAGNALHSVHGKYCGKLVTTGMPAIRAGVHFVVPRRSKYYKRLTKASLELRIEGRTMGLDEFWERQTKCRMISSPIITVKKLKWFFLGVGIIYSGFVASLIIGRSLREKRYGEKVRAFLQKSSLRRAYSGKKQNEKEQEYKNRDIVSLDRKSLNSLSVD